MIALVTFDHYIHAQEPLGELELRDTHDPPASDAQLGQARTMNNVP
jgi:hypothetical protein